MKRHHRRVAVKPQPLEVQATATREGGTLHVAVTGIARGHGEGEPYEDPTAWQVSASGDDGRELTRVVNGPARLERNPVGEVDADTWDVVVSFSVYFQLPTAATRVQLHVVPPAPGTALSIPIELAR